MARRTTFVSDEVTPHDNAVKKIQSLCDMHRIPFGEAGDLRTFAGSLQQDRHLAMDFWAIVGELSARERGSFSDDEMLDTIVEAVSGHLIQSLPSQEKEATHLLQQLLAGVDIGAPLLPDAIAQPQDALLPTEHERATRNLHRDAPLSGEEIHVARARVTIAEALLRLEETSRELREQLATIERAQKRDDISSEIATEPIVEEPPTEPEPAQIDIVPVDPVAPLEPSVTAISQPVIIEVQRDPDPDPNPQPPIATTLNPEVAPAIDAIERSPQFQAAHEPEIFAPRPAHTLSQRGFAPEETDDDPSIVVPLEAYAITHQRNLFARIAAVVVLIALAFGVWFAVHRGYAQRLMAEYAPSVHEHLDLFRQELRELTGNKTAATTTAPSPTLPPVDAARASANPAKRASTNAKSQAKPKSNPPAPAPAAVRTEPSQPAPTPVHAQPQQAQENAFRVPASIMEANLISSRVPAYPASAKALRIEGTVVLQAIISRSGTVERVHTLSGDSHLRGAAEEAVLKRRYKPYAVNGTPIEVATEVKVPFRLPRR